MFEQLGFRSIQSRSFLVFEFGGSDSWGQRAPYDHYSDMLGKDDYVDSSVTFQRCLVGES